MGEFQTVTKSPKLSLVEIRLAVSCYQLRAVMVLGVYVILQNFVMEKELSSYKISIFCVVSFKKGFEVFKLQLEKKNCRTQSSIFFVKEKLFMCRYCWNYDEIVSLRSFKNLIGTLDFFNKLSGLLGNCIRLLFGNISESE